MVHVPAGGSWVCFRFWVFWHIHSLKNYNESSPPQKFTTSGAEPGRAVMTRCPHRPREGSWLHHRCPFRLRLVNRPPSCRRWSDLPASVRLPARHPLPSPPATVDAGNAYSYMDTNMVSQHPLHPFTNPLLEPNSSLLALLKPRSWCS